jgi:hypothetical protein
MIYTISKLEKLFKDIAERHLQIDSFGYGFDFQYENKKQLERGMVSFWVQPLTTQVVLSRSNTQVVRRFRLYAFDLIRRDEKNLISVWNSTEEILIDFIRLFSFSYGDIKLQNSPVLVPFTEVMEDDLTGYYADIDLTSWDLSGDCEIPLKPEENGN